MIKGFLETFDHTFLSPWGDRWVSGAPNLSFPVSERLGGSGRPFAGEWRANGVVPLRTPV
jgi:hypothetical protein